MSWTCVILLAAAAAAGGTGSVAGQEPGAARGGDRIYGRVTTVSGRVVEGFLRWDRDEGSWVDILNGTKEIPEENREEAARLGAESARARERSVEYGGVRVTWEEEPEWPDAAEAGVRFGHLAALLVGEDDQVRLDLKNGHRLDLSPGSSDLGPAFRGLQVERAGEGVLDLSWEELSRVEFLALPPDGPEPLSARLHGTATDRMGNVYTGYVAWDLDEILTTDVLDGEEDGSPREIPFSAIASIDRLGPGGARVILADGGELELRGSNDVGRGNRGIQLSDPGLGQVRIGWNDFVSIRFHPPDRPVTYADFDGGRRLRGVVRSEEGDSYAGTIRWDNDEEWSWEILDGRLRDVVYDVELAAVSRIERRGPGGVEVTLRDGRVLELRDSNDVDRANKGVFVTSDEGVTTVVDWTSFRDVIFEGG